jgi:hypothetical protein
MLTSQQSRRTEGIERLFHGIESKIAAYWALSYRPSRQANSVGAFGNRKLAASVFFFLFFLAARSSCVLLSIPSSFTLALPDATVSVVSHLGRDGQTKYGFHALCSCRYSLSSMQSFSNRVLTWQVAATYVSNSASIITSILGGMQ